MTSPIKHKKRMEGVVVSDKMQKTVVVKVRTRKKHPIYKKYYWTSKKYKAHDPLGRYHEGDEVIVEETRPISRDKKWKVIY